MSFKPENTAAVKLNTDELMKEAYLDYCAHLARGLSKRSWYFRDEKRLLCTFQTMEKYMKEKPDVLDPIHKHISDVKGFAVWEQKGMSMMNGESHSEPALYQIFMRNKYDWDKPEKSQAAEDAKVDLKNYSEALKEQREQLSEQPKDRTDLPESKANSPA